MQDDEEIYNAIISDPRMTNIIYANIEECNNKKLYPPNGIATTDDAIQYLEKKFATGQAKEYRVKKVESILDHSLLLHLGDTKNDRMKKAIFLGRIARNSIHRLDCLGLYCPVPILQLRERIDELPVGSTLEFLADDPAAEEDVKRWAKRTGNEIVDFKKDGVKIQFLIKKVK